jgi:hypothetical protein
MATITSSWNFFISDFNARIEKCRNCFSILVFYLDLYSSIKEEGIEALCECFPSKKVIRARNCRPFKKSRNQFPAWWNRFLCSISVYKYGLRSNKLTAVKIVFDFTYTL